MPLLNLSDDVLPYLGLSADTDGVVADIQAGVEAQVVAFTTRDYVSTAREEYIDGGTKFLAVRFPPVDTGETMTITDVLADPDVVVDSGDYDVYPERGHFYLVDTSGIFDFVGKWSSGRRKFKVEYTGGVDGVPDDVKLAMLMLIKDRHARQMPGLVGTKLGDYEIKYANDTGAGLPEEIREMLGASSGGKVMTF